jgi:hypothetical protein
MPGRLNDEAGATHETTKVLKIGIVHISTTDFLLGQPRRVYAGEKVGHRSGGAVLLRTA